MPPQVLRSLSPDHSTRVWMIVHYFLLVPLVMCCFNWVNLESKDLRAPVLNSVRTLHVPKIKLFSSQPDRLLFTSPIWGIFLRVFDINTCKGWGSLSQAQFPTWSIGVFLYVWVITFDLSVMEDLASSYVTASKARSNDDEVLFGRKGLDATGDWRKLHDEDLHDINPNLIFGWSKSRKRDRRGFWHLKGEKEMHTEFWEEGKKPLEQARRK